jgi:hypothetical protein
MSHGSIVLVHGTGARLRSYKSGFQKAKDIAAANGISQSLVECAWGDPLGVTFEGLSVPGTPPDELAHEREEDFARWRWLFDDPLFELDKLTIRDTSDIAKPAANPRIMPDSRGE